MDLWCHDLDAAAEHPPRSRVLGDRLTQRSDRDGEEVGRIHDQLPGLVAAVVRIVAGRPCSAGPVRRGRRDPVGRLDADTEGLIPLTNDGELANRLAHPSYGVAKTYLATVAAPLARGVLAGGRCVHTCVIARRCACGAQLSRAQHCIGALRVTARTPYSAWR